jgi:hypothetical protein
MEALELANVRQTKREIQTRRAPLELDKIEGLMRDVDFGAVGRFKYPVESEKQETKRRHKEVKDALEKIEVNTRKKKGERAGIII